MRALRLRPDPNRELGGMEMGLGFLGWGSAGCECPAVAAVLRGVRWSGMQGCRARKSPSSPSQPSLEGQILALSVALQTWDEPGPCLHRSVHLLLPQHCLPLGPSSSVQPQSLLLLPERLTQHCIKWSVCLMDITMHLLQPDLGFFLIFLLPQPSPATVSDF